MKWLLHWQMIFGEAKMGVSGLWSFIFDSRINLPLWFSEVSVVLFLDEELCRAEGAGVGGKPQDVSSWAL